MAFFRAPYPTLPHQPQPQPQPQPPPPPLETTTLLVKHLPEAMTEEMLSRLFSHYGASSVRPCAAGKLRNCAFVDFKDEATAYHAQCQLNRLSFLGKVLAVERASQINKKAQDEKSEEILSGSKPVQNEASINQKKLTSGPEPIAPTLGIDYPFPPHLEYQYPPPDGNILTNIVNALIAVPRFYTQEDEEGRKRKKVKREVIVGPAVDKSVAHESVGLNTVIVPKEPPVMKKKTPVLQIKIASKPVHQGTSEDSRDANEQKEITDMKEKEMVAEEQFATAQELENGKMPPEEILSLPMFKVSKYLNCIPIPPHHLLPPSDRKTLFLDLDHTLIVSNKVPPPEKFASADQIVLTPRNTTRYIIKRPGVEQLLRAAVASNFEIVIFTSASRLYASPIIDWLDPNREFISHRLYQDACTRSSGGHHHKDLTVTGRRLDWSVVIDDHPELYGKHRQNVIPVSSFHGDPKDLELLKVQSFFVFERLFKDLRCAAQIFVKIQNLSQFLTKGIEKGLC